jgi:menaquinone-9 beta-reductase
MSSAEIRADVLVVGAGPAGCAAAITARRHDLRVIVADKAVFPRDKTCGDGLTAAALRQLESLGIPAPSLAGYERVRETVVVSPSGRQVALPVAGRGHLSAVVPRIELDAALVAAARHAGATVREGAGIMHLSDVDGTGSKTIVAELDDGTCVAASHLVAADGHYSATRRLLEPEAPADLGTWHAFRQYMTGVDDRRQWVVFERDLLPGYAWVFPLPGHRANVGFGVCRDASGRAAHGRALHDLAAGMLDRPRLRAILGPAARSEGPTRAWPIPARYTPARLAHGRVLFAGDAAGVVDPMTGEGIAQAFETGALAAQSIAAGGDAAQVGAAYRRRVEHALGRDLRFAAVLGGVLRTPFGARGAVRAAGLNDWTRHNFARWMFEDYPRALVLTPDRWRRGALRPPPTFASSP